MRKQCEGRFRQWFVVSGGGGSFIHSFLGARVLRARRSIGRSVGARGVRERTIFLSAFGRHIRHDTTHSFDSFDSS